MSRSHRNPTVQGLVALLLALAPASLDAQEVVSLVSFTNTWRYTTNNANQGTVWRTSSFDDSAWPSGNGLLGWETGNPQNYTPGFNTLFTPFDPTIITYYFRTRCTNTTPPIALMATNLVDDGLVIYLNGVEAGRIRVPAGQNWQTLANGSPTVEGQSEVFAINPALLLFGTNVVAVEVHQNGTASGDVAFGMSLVATLPAVTPMSITNQPQDKLLVFGQPDALTVGVSGGPGYYQWQADNGAGAFTNIPGATSTALTNGASALGANAYRVHVYNGSESITSSVAVVTVVPDNQGPRMLSATVREEAARTNRIVITWNEFLANTTVCVACLTNFRVVLTPSNVPVTISNMQYNPTGGEGGKPSTILTMSTTNWHIGSNYYVSVNRVRDLIGNVVAPDSRVAVAWPRHTDVMQADHVWSFHSASVFEPDIFDQPWTATNYVEGSWWGSAPGPFCGGLYLSSCFGPLQTEIGWQPEPSLFRTTFFAPTSPGFGQELRFSRLVDDGAVFYLNGVELFRYNLPPWPTPLTSQTRATNSAQTGCVTNTVQVGNLLRDKNWLAVAVFQSSTTVEADTAFGLRLRHTYFVPGPLPEVPVPQLNIAVVGTNRYRLWWDGPGYALESATSLGLTGPGALGAWSEVTNMANPFTNILTGERRFFRLRQ